MGSIPGPPQWVKDPALLQVQLRSRLRLGSDPWPRSGICCGVAKNERERGKNKLRGLGFFFVFFLFVCLFVFCLFAFSRAASAAYGGSQARGLIRAVLAGLYQSHSNTVSEPSL